MKNSASATRSPESRIYDSNLALTSQASINRSYPLDETWNRQQKRFFDIVFSLLVITLVLSWLLPLLAVFIKLTSRGPVFFIQERSGLHYKSFRCIKLRTMQINDEADISQATPGDPRITLAGRFLRKFSLDELPQFFNVLKGEMSIIGPRPHMISHTFQYAAMVDHFALRHLVKPGITGLSQVEGYRGEIRCKKTLNNRVRLDVFYIRKWNFALDLHIVLKTTKLLLFGDKNAF